MRITTRSGFECDIKESAFDDYRIVKMIARMQEESGAEQLRTVTEIISRVLGDEQEEDMISFLEERSEEGIATVEAMQDELQAIMEALAEAKKKS